MKFEPFNPICDICGNKKGGYKKGGGIIKPHEKCYAIRKALHSTKNNSGKKASDQYLNFLANRVVRNESVRVSTI